MFRGGGSAGGGKDRNQFTYIKPMPKFLQQFRYQANNSSEAGIVEKMREITREAEEAQENEYDVENATVVRDDGGQQDSGGGEEGEAGKIQKEKKNRARANNIAAEKSIVNGEKVDLQQFKPQFVTKKNDQKPSSNNKTTSPLHSEVQKNQNSQPEKKELVNEKRKANIDLYVEEALRQEKPKKKVKTNTLSFGDD